MELLNRYLLAVRFLLPPKQQQDIIEELSEDIRAQFEDKETELGRELDDEDRAAILNRQGHPIIVASGFWAEQYPMDIALWTLYPLVLRIVLGWVITPLFLLISVPSLLVAPDPIRALFCTLLEYGHAVVFAVGMITIAFALRSRFPVRL